MPRKKMKRKQSFKSQNILNYLRTHSDNIHDVFPDVNNMYTGGRTLLTLAIENGEDVSLVEAIVISGADVNLKNAKGQTALMVAARCKRNDALQLLVNFGAKLDLMNDKKMTALSICVAEDFIEGVTMLVKSGSDVNLQIGKVNETAIELATRLNLKHIEEILLRLGNFAAVNKNSNITELVKHTEPSPNIPSSVVKTNHVSKREAIDGFLQITRHSTNGHNLSFKTLSNLAKQLHKTGSLNVQDDSGKTLLMHTVIRGSEKSVHFICSLGAEINMRDSDGRSVLMYVFMSKLSLSTHTLYQLFGQNPCAQDKYGKSALMYAFENKFHLPLHLVKLLLGQAFLVHHPYVESFLYRDISLEKFQNDIQNIVDNEGKTHLMYAIMNVPNLNLDMLSTLAVNLINARDRSGNSALIYAVYSNQNQIESLINLGADPEIVDYDGRTAAMIAMSLKLDMTSSMLKALIGKNTNRQDKNGKTVLMYALEFFISEEQIETILNICPKIDVQDNDGKTALMYALKISTLLSNTLFEKLASGDVNKQDGLGLTALMYALQYNASNDRIKTLILRGSDVNIRDKKHTTVLEQLTAEKINQCWICAYYKSAGMHFYFEFANFIIDIQTAGRRNHQNNTCSTDIVQLMIEHSSLLLSKENRFIATKCFQTHYNNNFKNVCSNSKTLLQKLLSQGIFLKPEPVKGSKFQETSYLLVALELGHLDLAKYLMANYCMTNKDLKFLKTFYTTPLFSRSGFIELYSMISEIKVSKETIQFVEHATSQPWPLVSLALLAISSTISFDENRIERVSELPIPQKMRNYLTFRSPEASVPVEKWSEISVFGQSTNKHSRRIRLSSF